MKKIARRMPIALGFPGYVLSLAGFAMLAFFVYALATGAGAAQIIGLGVGMAVAFVLSAVAFRIQGLQSHGAIGGAFLDTQVYGEREHIHDVVDQIKLDQAADHPVLLAA